MNNKTARPPLSSAEVKRREFSTRFIVKWNEVAEEARKRQNFLDRDMDVSRRAT